MHTSGTANVHSPIPLCNGGFVQCHALCRSFRPIPHEIVCHIGGAGMGAYYYTGVMYLLKCLERRRKVRVATFHGSSSGAVASVAYLFDINPDVWTQEYRFIQCEYAHGCYLSHAYVRLLRQYEPADALLRIRGRLRIYVTEVSFGLPQRCIRRFSSTSALYQAIVASTSIPWVTIPTLATRLGDAAFIDGMGLPVATHPPTDGRIHLRLEPPATYPFFYRLVPCDPSIHSLIQRGWDDAHTLFNRHAPERNATLTLP
jgi:hypothetical protein